MPIRVLHLITRLIVGGAQENALDTARLLDKSRWEVAVVAGPETGSEGSLIQAAREQGVDLTIQPALVRRVHPLKDLLAVWRLRRLIKDGRYTIVHTHSSKAGILGRWAARFAGAPVIVHTVHGWGHHSRQRPIVRAGYIWLERLTSVITDRLIVVSSLSGTSGLVERIATADDYVTIRSGIDVARFSRPRVARRETRAYWRVPQEAVVIGTVTRLSPQKAPLDFVRAAAMVVKEAPGTWFIMVGDGPLRGAVEKLAAELRIADQLVLTGLRADVPELLAAFDVFALSSLWEGLPRVLPQAMAAGLPIVSTACDGCVEAVQHEVTGLLTPPGEPAALATAVLSLLKDPALARRVGAAGRGRAEAFSDRTMLEQIEALYVELLAKKGIREARHE
jgi:glycosyltransferase involved in cell wall biosynthesis